MGPSPDRSLASVYIHLHYNGIVGQIHWEKWNVVGCGGVLLCDLRGRYLAFVSLKEIKADIGKRLKLHGIPDGMLEHVRMSLNVDLNGPYIFASPKECPLFRWDLRSPKVQIMVHPFVLCRISKLILLVCIFVVTGDWNNREQFS
jgi:hypothetical protein